jgi:rod shape-determining protein MreD
LVVIAMTPTILTRLDRLWRNLLPAASVLLSVMLTALPVGLPSLTVVMPVFTLMSIYYWTLSRPELMAAPFIFLIGLFQDSLSGAPMGLSAIVFLSGHYFVISQRRLLTGQSFALTWFGFSVLALMASTLAWIIVCIFYSLIVPVGPSAIQAFLTIVLYPPVALGLAQVQRLLPRGI